MNLNGVNGVDVSSSLVKKFVIHSPDRVIDPITVFLDDIRPSVGKITIECYGQAWSAWWDGMGGRCLTQFFVDTGDDYLVSRLSDVSHEVDDYEAFYCLLSSALKREIEVAAAVKRLNPEDHTTTLLSSKLSQYEELLGDDGSLFCDDDGKEWCIENRKMINDLLDEDWFENFPKKENHEYKYVCDIVAVVKDGLRESMKVANNFDG